MSKAVLISIRPKWCELIASGKKTVEIRKTRPKLETPFKCYIYCTNKKPFLVWGDVYRGNWETEFTSLYGYNRKRAEEIWDVFNGRVMGEFICDRIDVIPPDMLLVREDRERATSGSCLTEKELRDYLRGKQDSHNVETFPDLYCWHISDLEVYDTPEELSEFNLKRPPQSWCYVKGKESEDK